MTTRSQARHSAGKRPDGITVIAGLGATGLSCVRFFRRQGRPVVVADTRDSPPGLEVLHREFPEVRVNVGGLPGDLLGNAMQVIASPGLGVDTPLFVEARQRRIPVVSDIDLFARAATAPIIAITGSNGKSTVTRMVAAMLEASGREARAGGNLGPPALDLLTGDEPDFYVLELSSFQLETVRALAPSVASVLNISPDHMDRHGSLESYAMTKARIFDRCHVAVINRDDPIVAGLQIQAMTVSFGMDAPQPDQFGLREVAGETWLARGATPIMKAGELHLVGRHNLANALAALAIASASGVPVQVAAQALRNFRGLPHRMQRVASIKGTTWINDSKGTNVGATVAAIKGLDGNLVLIAGGDGKGADFMPLADAAFGRVHTAVLLGRDARAIGEVLEDRCTVIYADSMEKAVREAAAVSHDGDTVLMSPACASFDMFKNFEQRGEEFAKAVRGLMP